MTNDTFTTEQMSEECLKVLASGSLVVEFIKKDGTLRTMRCTRNPDLITENYVKKTDGTREPIPGIANVWDLDKSAWRSFAWDDVQRVLVPTEGN